MTTISLLHKIWFCVLASGAGIFWLVSTIELLKSLFTNSFYGIEILFILLITGGIVGVFVPWGMLVFS